MFSFLVLRKIAGVKTRQHVVDYGLQLMTTNLHLFIPRPACSCVKYLIILVQPVLYAPVIQLLVILQDGPGARTHGAHCLTVFSVSVCVKSFKQPYSLFLRVFF